MPCRVSSLTLVGMLLWWTTAVVVAFPRWSAAQHEQGTTPATTWRDKLSSFASSSSCKDDDTQGNEDVTDASPQAILQRFLQDHGATSTTTTQKKTMYQHFKIQGWRWHTMSLIHETTRLATALQQQQHRSGGSLLTTAVDYIVQFNLHGLHRIQSQVFFPWVRQQVTQRAPTIDVATAFGSVMDDLEAQASKALQLGQALETAVAKESPEAWQTATALRDTAQHMLHTEETLLIPLVAHLIPTSTQSWLNQRVLATLGVWDSRLHLVGMHQAIQHNATEMARFQQEIPYLARSMIPRWKRLLYDPRVEALEK